MAFKKVNWNRLLTRQDIRQCYIEDYLKTYTGKSEEFILLVLIYMMLENFVEVFLLSYLDLEFIIGNSIKLNKIKEY